MKYLAIISALLASCGGGGSGVSSPYVPPPVVPPSTGPNLSWVLTPSFRTLPSGKYCVLTVSVFNTGDLPSGTVSASARNTISSAVGGVPWSSSVGLRWQETASELSVVPGHSSLNATYSFLPDNNGKYIASVWVSAFGYITSETNEGGGVYSSQFYPSSGG